MGTGSAVCRWFARGQWRGRDDGGCDPPTGGEAGETGTGLEQNWHGCGTGGTNVTCDGMGRDALQRRSAAGGLPGRGMHRGWRAAQRYSLASAGRGSLGWLGLGWSRGEAGTRGGVWQVKRQAVAWWAVT